ncbi:MAG: UPF0175 family protein [Nitrospinae bacterium]|nr:UPF0175 family protein [Nitrospinota bacterium]
MNITLELPDTLVQDKDLTEFETEFKLNNAMMMYRQGKVSLSKGAALANMNIYAFISECKTNEIPVIDYDEGELQSELESLKKDF